MNIIDRDYPNHPEGERWRLIHKELFSEAEKPKRGAAYLGEGAPLAVSMANDYWGSRGLRLVAEYLAKENKDEAKGFSEEALVLCELAGKELVRWVVEDDGY